MREKNEGGFTLIELLVVVLIIGVMAKVAVPQYFKLVEKGKANEAVNAFQAIRGSQDRYKAKYGGYCNAAITACAGFDLTIPTLKYFSTPTSFGAGSGTPSWQGTLTRSGSPAIYGAYVITYDVEPGVAANMTCSNTSCSADLLPVIR